VINRLHALMRWRPVPVIMPLLAALGGIALSVASWQLLTGFNRTQIDMALQRQIAATVSSVESDIEDRVLAIERLAERAAATGLSSLELQAPFTVRDFRGIEALTWSDTSTVIVGGYPEAPNRELLGHKMLDDAIRAPALRLAMDTRSVAVSSPYEFVGRGRAALVVAPVGDLGFAYGRLRLPDLLDAVIESDQAMIGAGVIGGLRVADGATPIYSIGRDEPTMPHTQRVLRIRNLTLAVTLWPSKDWVALMSPMGPAIALASGIALSLLLGLVLLFWERARRQGRQLEAGEERLRLALAGANDGLFDWDLTGNAAYFAPRWKEMLGYADAEIPAVLESWSDRIHPDDRERVLAALAAFRTGSDAEYRIEHRLRHRDGSYRWILARGLGIRDGAGRLTRLIGAHTDMTARHSLEDSLHERTVELQRSNDELERFAYAASHDLQEPLRMVVSFTKLLERKYADRLDATAREYIAFAVDGATRMQVMINDLLQFSRVSTRGGSLGPVDMEVALSLALRNLQVAIAESGARVTHDPLPRVMGDATQLMQVLQNLIANAVKFRGDRSPQVHVSAALRDGRWRFTIADNGIGIEEKFRERIFLIFQRLHGRGEYPGNGIGLSLCKRIIERHGGTIGVESVPGSGSTFHFTLVPIEEQVHGDDRREQDAA